MKPSRLGDMVVRLGARSPRALVRFLRAVPPPLLRAVAGRSFTRALAHAGRRSPFYRKEFARRGLHSAGVRRPADLGEFYTTPEDLRAAPEEFLCGRPDMVLESSGTTGRIARVFLTYPEFEYHVRQAVLLYGIYGIGRDDRVLGVFEYAWGLGGILTHRMLPYGRAFGVCAGLVDPAEALRRVGEYRFNVIIGDPFWLCRFTEIAKAEGIRFPMKLFLSGAERITDQARGLVEAYWGAPLYMTYGSTEAATCLGFECPEKAGYHVNEFDFAVELFEPDAEGYGEIVFTTLSRPTMPLVRYRTRDVARLIPAPCPCGLPFRRISAIRGRSDEVIPSVWGNVHPELFDGILSGVPGIADEWQVALRQVGLKPVFQFRLVLAGGDPQAVIRAIRGTLERALGGLWAKHRQGMVDLEFAFGPAGRLRTGRKVRRLVDEREGGGPGLPVGFTLAEGGRW